jgi:hypothetical protein
MAAHNAQEEDHQLLILLTHEKTVRYAQTQIAEGELLVGKSIIDGVARQLTKRDAIESEAVELRRASILAAIATVQEEIARARIGRARGKNLTEIA